jgi:5-methylcytosine-specific restriction endonuclease McrA
MKPRQVLSGVQRGEVGRMTKAERMQVYEKYGGHCAYCGKKIEYKDMQVDHIAPLCRGYHGVGFPERDCMENYNPSCRRCNYYKTDMSLESFRIALLKLHERMLTTLKYKVAADYGIIKIKPWDGVFYFERGKEDE